MSYKLFIEGQRYQIQAYLHEGLSHRCIAKKLGVSHTTIGREINRNSTSEIEYKPCDANRMALQRRRNSNKYRIDEYTQDFVEFGLSLKWSPEQISGVGKLLNISVSHDWIYGYVQADKLYGGKLYKQLRHGHRRYRKGEKSKRAIIPNRVSIEQRPSEVDTGNRFGNWEVDTVLGKQGTGAIDTLVERKSKLYLLRKVPAKRAEDVRKAMISMLWRYRGSVRTITADNGTEFCEHELVAEKLQTDIYFANPYSSWERGLNENFNGLLRQYIKKGTDLRTITDKDIQRIEKS